jgi:hypothetical protein
MPLATSNINDRPTSAAVGQQPFGGARLRDQRQGGDGVEPGSLHEPEVGQAEPSGPPRLPVSVPAV